MLADRMVNKNKIKENFKFIVFLIMALVSSGIFAPSSEASISPWTQIDWSGGAGQTDWSDSSMYSAASSVFDATANQLTLTNTEQFSNTDFEYDLTGWSSVAASLDGNLAAYWTFDENTGTNVADSVNSSDGTWQGSLGSQWTTGVINSGGNFIAANTNYVNIPDTVNLHQTTDLTFSGWFKWTDANTKWLHGKINTLDNGWYFYTDGVPTNAYKLVFVIYNGSLRYNLFSPFKPTNNTWYNIVITFSTGTATLYVNGSPVSWASAPPVLPATLGVNAATSLTIGGYIGGGYYFGGQADEVGIWSRAISGDEASLLYNSGSGLQYPFYSATRDAGVAFNGSTASAKVVAGDATNFTQSINVGDTNNYNLTAYAYTDGSAVASSDAELYYNGSTVTTSYTDMGGGWYELSGTVTGANAARDYGVQVKAGQTVYLDDFSLNNYASSGALTSSIFDSEQGSNWGSLTYSATAPANASYEVRVRTSNDSNMPGDFSGCESISSGTTLGSTSCVTDTERYAQYEITLTNTDTTVTPTFTSISIVYLVSDATPPVISFDALSPDPSNDNTPTFTGNALDAVGTVASVEYQLDGVGGAWTDCSADDGTFNSASEDFTCSVSTPIADGAHTMNVRATDSNGNTTADIDVSTDSFTIDATAPTVSIDAVAPDPTNDNTPTITGAATDATTVLTAIEIEFGSDPGNWVACAADDGTIDEVSEDFSCEYGSALADGAETISVRATDSASNTTAAINYGTDSFTIDASAPIISLDALSPDPGSETKPTFTGSVTDAGNTISYVQFQMDSTSGSWRSCTADDGTFDSLSEDFSCEVTIDLSVGNHTVYVRARDSLSNWSADSAYSDSFEITSPTTPTPSGGGGSPSSSTDSTPPSLAIDAIFPDPGIDISPELTGSAIDSTSPISLVVFRLDSLEGSEFNCQAQDGSFGDLSEKFFCQVPSALSPGEHTIYIWAKDSLGNTSAVASDSFVIYDITDPALSIKLISDHIYTNATRPYFSWLVPAAAVELYSKYSISADNGDSGDFNLENIAGLSADYSAGKYFVNYKNFNDFDSTNNSISVQTRTSADWLSSENDGELKEGERNWTLTSTDISGNKKNSTGTIFVDKSAPTVLVTYINGVYFSSDSFMTSDQTPSIFGKILDYLAGDSMSNKVASGPDKISIKIEKKNGVGVYGLHTLATVNIPSLNWLSDKTEISDNTQNKSDKYANFEFTPTQALDFGEYRISMNGYDRAGNVGASDVIYLKIEPKEKIVVAPKEEIPAKEEPLIEPTEIPIEEISEEPTEITVPIEPSGPSFIERTKAGLDQLTEAIINVSRNVNDSFDQFATEVTGQIGGVAKGSFDATQRALSFLGTNIMEMLGDGLAVLSSGAPGTANSLFAGLRSGVSSTILAISGATENAIQRNNAMVNNVNEGVKVASGITNKIFSAAQNASSVFLTMARNVVQKTTLAMINSYAGAIENATQRNNIMVKNVNEGVKVASGITNKIFSVAKDASAASFDYGQKCRSKNNLGHDKLI
ncbi:MAG TPA: LamG-like jellyroll fold domain-containing protein [Candidatus Bipolaricaulota bacterium]|nr:LamG-like jellyroll fold domain-containing protein [Candidatus Bipolaricaulota bacterium]